MTYRMNVPVDYNKILADATQLVMSTEYASGEDIGLVCSLADYEDDVQFRLLYECLTAAHARAQIYRADPNDKTIVAKVVEAHWKGEHSYAVVDFRSETDAMLFKLAFSLK